MNGFLSALVARAEGRLPVLDRRPRALFEPEAGASARLREAPEMTGDGDAVTSQHVEPDPGHSSVQQLSRRDVEDTPRPALRTPQASSRATASGRTPAVNEALPESHQENGSASAADAGRVGLLVARAIPASAAAPAEAARARIDVTSSRADESRDADSPAASERVDGIGAADVARPSIPPAPSATRAGGLLEQRSFATSRSAAVSIASAQAPMAVRRAEPASATTSPAAPVQISIGRIEIRAVAGNAGAKPRAVGPAAPRLSLDDYLRSRNGAPR